MAYSVTNKCAKICYKQTVLVQLIIKDMVTCFFGTQCKTGQNFHPPVRSCGVNTFKALILRDRSGLVVGRRTCDLRVAGSRPGRDAAAQQP